MVIRGMSFAVSAFIAMLAVNAVAKSDKWLDLSSTQRFNPPGLVEGKILFDKPQEVQIPELLRVTSGSSCGGLGTILVTNQGSTESCVFEGGKPGLFAYVSFSLKTLKAWALGFDVTIKDVFTSPDKLFWFDGCTGGQTQRKIVGDMFVLTLAGAKENNDKGALSVTTRIKNMGDAAPQPTPTATASPSPSPSPTASPSPSPTPIGNLPPDPGEAGKATLEGIDADGDGLRDDIQRWIYFKIPHSERAREATRRYAIEATKALTLANDKAASIAHTKILLDASDCANELITLNPPSGDTRTEERRGLEAGFFLNSLAAVILNTPERSRAQIKGDQNFGGQIYHMTNDALSVCTFDFASMRN